MVDEARKIARGQMVKIFAFRAKEFGYFTRDNGESLKNFDHWAAS